MSQWGAGAPGVMGLPSGRLVRGRGLRHAPSEGRDPDFGLYLLGRAPALVGWDSRWIAWRDFGLPRDRDGFREALADVWERAETDRVESACAGGRGRTATALSCLAVIDGVAAHDAVSYVRAHYDRRAVETRWQRRFVERFG